ncbi:MAG: ribbon-helix-helix domain-containing protein [Actinomycetaceae bacterium]|nr:ribbon-helix-helix domain-containing protein [Actinomycetaceae bacterium]
MKINLGSKGMVEITSIEDINLDEADFIVDGKPFTEAAAEALALEISRRHGRKGGRPPKNPTERASHTKAVRLTDSQAHRLQNAAAEQGLPESEIIRQALDQYLLPTT